jgi:hypothetical protein
MKYFTHCLQNGGQVKKNKVKTAVFAFWQHDLVLFDDVTPKKASLKLTLENRGRL